MSVNYNAIEVEGNLKAVGNRVLVSDMYFGEQKTAGGIIITDDDGTTRGVYPRWGRVYKKGPRNNDPYSEGDWVLVEHGRWTRGVKIGNGEQELEIRMVEAESILGWADEKPEGVVLGNEYSDGESASFDPSSFVSA
jgi:co-chaperonin GroES (HSP10)